jgi:two-component system phosphate regulon response regulator OmpR
MATAAEILVVEDEPELREMVAEYLARHGFAVRMAIDGEAMAARPGKGGRSRHPLYPYAWR